MNRTEKKDLQGYSFIRSRVAHTGITPSLREIGRAVGYTSPRSVQLMLERLEKRGLLRYSAGLIRLSGKPNILGEQTIEVPLLGSIAAGAPMLAEENVEAIIPVSTALARPGSKYFLLRVVGTSMNEAKIGGVKIEDGSIVLVRQQESADDGDVVVALINDAATVKILERKNGMVILRPKSSGSHMPIVLTDNCVIQGVVVAVLPSDLN